MSHEPIGKPYGSPISKDHDHWLKSYNASIPGGPGVPVQAVLEFCEDNDLDIETTFVRGGHIGWRAYESVEERAEREAWETQHAAQRETAERANLARLIAKYGFPMVTP